MARVIALFILSGVMLSSMILQAAEPLRVCSQCNIKTLKQAIEQALPGSTILVEAGIYQESNLTIRQPLTLRAASAEARPVLDISGQGSGFILEADHIEINGFLIKNSGFSYTEEIAGIKVLNTSHCQLLNNRLEGNAFGIYVAQSKSCRIANNQIHGTHKSESLSGNGIHIWNGSNMIIENNDLSRNRDGIYFEFVSHSSIRKNNSHGNLRYGLHFMYSHFNEYRENEFVGNECGVAVMYSHGVQMFRNRFARSRGTSSYGLLLKDISDSQVIGNIFRDDTVGIFIDGTTRSLFQGNLFKNNGWALHVLGDTDSNQFLQNDFIDNTFDVATNATTNLNEFRGNYWSRYQGLDLDKNGIGDDPYRPVHLSSMLIENYQAAILLVNSLFFTALDQIESALPVLTPEAYKDLQPRLKRATNL